MIGSNIAKFQSEEAREAIVRDLRAVCATNREIHSRNQIDLSGDNKRWVAWTKRGLRNSRGEAVALHTIGRDIEEQVKIERRLQDIEAKYRLIAENTTDLILLIDKNGNRHYASPACYEILGYSQEEMLALRATDVLHPDDQERVLDLVGSEKQNHGLTYRTRRKDGRYIWVEATGKPVKVAGYDEPLRLGILRDIDWRVATEQRLKSSEARYRLLADNSTDIVFELDAALRQTYVSPSMREILGYDPTTLIGARQVDLVHAEDMARHLLAFETLLSGHCERMSITNRARHRDGRWIWMETELRSIRDLENEAVLGIVGSSRDISKRKIIEDELANANRRLKLLASEDALTGLSNRRTFDEALARECEQAASNGSSVALVMFDVDHFKALNDRYGHLIGDDCLRDIGRLMKEVHHDQIGSVASRYGGEEFAVLLPSRNEADAAQIGELIRTGVLALSIAHADSKLGIVSISAGAAAVSPRAGYNHLSLLRDADRALYAAKAASRNLVVRASELTRQARAIR